MTPLRIGLIVAGVGVLGIGVYLATRAPADAGATVTPFTPDIRAYLGYMGVVVVEVETAWPAMPESQRAQLAIDTDAWVRAGRPTRLSASVDAVPGVVDAYLAVTNYAQVAGRDKGEWWRSQTQAQRDSWLAAANRWNATSRSYVSANS